MDENFIVDFGEVTRVITEDFNKLNNRPSYAGELMTGDTNIPQVPSSVSELNNDSNYQTGAQVSEAIETEKEAREAADTALDGRLTTVEGIAATALQPSSIDKVVMTDINVGANTSTTTFNLDASKQNLLTGATSSKQVSMPVASSTEAGIMNSSTFDAVVNNTANINALTNGAVAITGLPSSPTQAQLTTAWENATGETSLMNRAGIYDVTNGKVWTYYTNDTTWHSTTNTTQVTINTFTNSSEGTIKGSTNVGQVFAEADGTGSVNGWDALNDAVGNNSSDISNLQTAVDGKQDKLIAGANINIAADGKTISATDTTYTAGNAIDITNGEISADIHPADFFTASDSISDCGSNLSLDNTIATKLKSVELKGDTYQQTYSGYNLIDLVPITNTQPTISQQCTFETVMDATLGRNVLHITGANNFPAVAYHLPQRLESGKYYALKFTYRSTVSGSPQSDAMWFAPSWAANYWDVLGSLNSGRAKSGDGDTSTYVGQSTAWKTTSRRFYIAPSQHSATMYSYTHICFSLGYNQNSTKEVWIADAEVYEITEDEWNADTYTSKDYEPYTGGIPAPSPDYPQDIQVVTGEQTVTVTGKNKINGAYSGISQTVRCSAEASGNGFKITSTSSSGATYVAVPIPNITSLLGQTVTLSYSASGSGIRIGFFYLNASGGATGNIGYSETVTLPDSLGSNVGIGVVFYTSNNGSATYNDIQLEIGSTTTAYQPYQSQSYSISLGSTELCKVGDYQDYIYKSGDDWYVHKDIGKVDIVSSGIAAFNAHSGTHITVNYSDANVEQLSAPAVINVSNRFIGCTSTQTWDGTVLNGVSQGTNNHYLQFSLPTSVATTQAEVRTYFDNHPTTVYYTLATPTDTKITDDSLVAQLNALAGAKSYNDRTNIIVTTAGENLPAILCVEAYQKSLNGLLGVIERLGA